MEKLVKKAKKGDAEAFIALMEQNRQSMIRIAFAYLGNEEDVADAMQETILSAFEKLDTLRRAEYFRTWLIRILINQCITILQPTVIFALKGFIIKAMKNGITSYDILYLINNLLFESLITRSLHYLSFFIR